MIKKILLPLVSLVIAFSAHAEGEKQTLDGLLKQVLSERNVQSKELKEREQEFINKKAQQKTLLNKAQKELAALEAESKRLNGIFEKNEKKLSVLEEELNIAVGTLGELFGVVRQVSGDFAGTVQTSVISSQFKGREPFLRTMAETKNLPDIPQLEKLWFELQQEMTESGKVVTYKTTVVKPSGEKVELPVTRVGSFNLVADGKYYVYQGETQQITELARQPSGRYLSLADDFADEDDAFAPFAIDPSRGTILSMLVNAPSLSERIQQGGLVGYVILALLLLGLVLAGERFVTLRKQKAMIDEQLTTDEPIEGNPLGSILKTFNEFKDKDLETLELKIDETVIKSTPPITKGISTLKILSAVAPLLGLLGTVTGMIQTFQSITLFGTGDPKLMAGGISQALITTVLGLVCAIPLLLIHNYINGKSKGILQILEEQSAGLMAQKTQMVKKD